jgi:curved DNA-binding protein
MPAAFKDYYRALGVGRNATDEEIKKAFRTLARQFHPDVAKDKRTAEGRFKEINEANEVLSDPEKRRKYDELGLHWDQPGRATRRPDDGFYGARPGEGSEFHFEGTGFSDFFEEFFGSRGRPVGGFAEFGRSGGRGMEDEPAAHRGHDIEGDILVTLGEVLRGSTRMLRLQRADPRTGQTAVQTLRVNIPPGVREGQLIRLAGKGQDGTGGEAAGHLYLRVAFAKHPDFRVRDADLYCDLELSPWEAVLGATVHIPALDGTVSLKIPAGTVAERQFRLRGKGLPAGDGARGDLYALVSIQVPPRLTAEEKALWERLAEKTTFNPRASA